MPDRVAVVGGGAVGLTAARDLATRGVDVVLYERDELGSGATGRAAGLCYDAYADRADATLAARALDRFREWNLLTERPYVWVAREGDEDVADAVREQAQRMASHGLAVETLGPHALAGRFPALRTDHLAVAAVAENAGYVHPEKYVRTMADTARAIGVRLRTDTPVSLAVPTVVRLDSETTRSFDAVVLAAGAHTADIAAGVGCSLALGTYRAQVLVTERVTPSPPLYYDASAEFYLRPWDGGVLVGDGARVSEDPPETVDRDADERFRRESLSRLETALDVDADPSRSWAGLCTATPDRDPLVGQCREGLYVATGWHGHGLMRAPAVGERLAAEILGGEGIDHFDPTRFDGDETIPLPCGVV